VSAAEAVEVGDLITEDGTVLTSAAVSSRTSSSSLESLSMIILSSSGGLRTSWLRMMIW
jgi:hypothetical protein